MYKRQDLFARLNLWTFTLPGLADRREDIEPNLEYELERFAEREGEQVTFNKEARDAYLAFATSPAASWEGNFRDLAASVTRMATLSPSGRIDRAAAQLEIKRMQALWSGSTATGPSIDEGPLEQYLSEDALEQIDPLGQSNCRNVGVSRSIRSPL